MIDHEVVDLPVADRVMDVVEKAAAESLLDRIDQRDFLVRDKVGVVGYAERQGPEGFKTCFDPIVDTDVMDAGFYLCDAHGKFYFIFTAK